MGAPTSEQLAAATRKLTENGRIIEAGWIGLRAMAVPANAPAIQVEEMRNAFFAGAQHLFSSIMTMLDPGADPTEADLGRMDQIQQELDEFISVYVAKNIPTDGSA